ncbi:MAG TPA: ABC transporter permease, partial [Vicinamibacterales bacterium]|nr:ABC transporter permease [Vicinamibacterales bacterium]
NALLVLTLAAGMAAATSGSALVKTLLVRPYPFPHLDRLVLVRDDAPREGVKQTGPLAPADVVSLERTTSAFEMMAAYRLRPATFGGFAEPEEIRLAETTADFWRLIDARALHGRLFVEADEAAGRNQVVVLSEQFWRARMGGADVIGREVRLLGRPFIIVGILPAAFRYPLGSEAWIPLTLTPAEWTERAGQTLLTAARLKQDVTVGAADADARRVMATLAAQFPDTNQGRSVRLVPLRTEQYEFTLVLFSAAEALAIGVLIVAALNAFLVLTARAMDDLPDAALRGALGGSPWQIVRPQVLETVFVAVLASGVGLVLSQAGLAALRRGVPPGITKWLAGWDAIGLDFTLGAGVLGGGLAIGLLLGGVSAGRLSRRCGSLVLAGTRGVGASRPRGRAVFLWLQCAVSIVLLIAAAFFATALARVNRTFDAFGPDRALTARVSLTAIRYPDDADVVQYFDRLAGAARTLPGVRHAGIVRNLPASNVPSPRKPVWPEEAPPSRVADQMRADVQVVGPGALEALQVPLAGGRFFEERDAAGAMPSVIVSRLLADQLWPGRDPLGRRLVSDDGVSRTVVGVVGDVRMNWFDQTARPTLYLPHAQWPARTMMIVARTPGSADALAAPLRAQAGDIDSDQPLGEVESLAVSVADSLSPLRTLGWLLVALAIVSLGLATIGVYGVTAVSVAERERELGIRMALGATPAGLARIVVGRAVRVAVSGGAAGAVTALVAAGPIGSRAFGFFATEPLVPLGASLALWVAAAAAAWAPARRAARTDPAVTLRAPM